MNDYNEYKIEQLRNMLTAETSEDAGGYGAHLDHWSGRAKPINLDADALRVLINYYESCADHRETKSFKLHTYDLQMIVIALIVPVFHWVAALIELVFPTMTIYARQLLLKKRETERTDKPNG